MTTLIALLQRERVSLRESPRRDAVERSWCYIIARRPANDFDNSLWIISEVARHTAEDNFRETIRKCKFLWWMRVEPRMKWKFWNRAEFAGWKLSDFTAVFSSTWSTFGSISISPIHCLPQFTCLTCEFRFWVPSRLSYPSRVRVVTTETKREWQCQRQKANKALKMVFNVNFLAFSRKKKLHARGELRRVEFFSSCRKLLSV